MGKKLDKHNYSAKLVRVVDGDTCDAMIDLGFNTWVKKRIRFYGVDWWESRTRDLEEKKKGLAAKEFVKKLEDLIPIGRMAKKDEITGTIVFLLSDASSYINGAVISVDGGRTSW